MVVRSGRTPFVGRERELDILLRHLEAASQGQGRLVLIGGEPGIGKTRLALELAGRARPQSWQVLVGHVYESEGMPPYLPFTEALSGYVRACLPEDLQAQLGPGAPEVARLLPVVRECLPNLPASLPLSPEHERYRLFESLCDFLLAMPQFGESRGLLLMLDDLQWADKSTLLLLQHLARRLEKAPLLVLGTYRTVELDRGHPLVELLADLSREELGEQLLLTSLSSTESADLIAALTGTTADPAIAETIYRQTEGIPFFLGELIRHLRAEGRDLADPRAALAESGVPAGVRQVIGKRLGRLSLEANRVLQVGATLGDGFTFEVLQATSDGEPEPLLDALDEAVGVGMLREEAGAYHFSHALIRQTVSAALSVPRRQRLHLRAAQALESVYQRNLGPHVTALAFHHRQAGPASSGEKVLTYARQAAEAATLALAWEEAATHLQIALDWLKPEEDQQRCELLLTLSEMQHRSGKFHAAIETARRASGIARTLQAPDAFGRAVLRIVGLWGERGTGNTEGVRPLVEEALSLLSEEDSVLRATLLARLAPEAVMQGERERGMALLEEAGTVARRLGDPATLGRTLQYRHLLLWSPDQLEERLAIAGEIVRLGEQANDRELALEGRGWRFKDLVELGDRGAFDRELPAIAGLASELRQPVLLWVTMLFQAMQALLEGRFDEAGRLSKQALPIGQRGRGWMATLFHQRQMAHLCWLRGRRSEMEAMARAAGPSGELARPLLGCVYAELGYETEARREYERALERTFASRLMQYGWEEAGWLCQLCALLGDTRRGGELYERFLPYSRRCFVYGYAASCAGAFAHSLGLLAVTMGRLNEAEQHFEEALEVNTRLGARPFLAQSQREYAATLLRRGGPGDPERARELLGQALTAHSELGMEHWAAKAQALLAHPSLAPSTPSYPDGLSRREVEILRLVATGRTNRAIAAQLAISPYTVARHVNHILSKTGAANRAEAASYAHRHGLIA